MGTRSQNSPFVFAAPAWAAFFTPSEYADFARLLTAEQIARGATGDVHQGGLRIRQPDGVRQEVGLINLAQICKGQPLTEWPKLIAEFFTNLSKGVAVAHDLLDGLADFTQIRSQLKLRLYPEDFMKKEAHLLVRRKIVEGIAAFLVCDMGHANVSVPFALTESWQKPVEELFAIGQQNVRAEGLLPVQPGPPIGGCAVDLLSSGSNYAATHLLFFEEYAQRQSGYGALVSVPNRHTIFRHTICDRAVLDAVPLMLQLASHGYKEGPGSISPALYWWRPGNLRQLAAHRLGDAVVFAPGEDFEREVLASLARGN